MDSLVPVISAAAGGMIAIGGAYLNQILSHKRQRSTENRDRTANKLEEVARLANLILKDTKLVVINVMGAAIGAKQIEETAPSDITRDEFLLMLRLYEPELLIHAEPFLSSSEKVISSALATMEEWTRTSPTIESYEELNDRSKRLIDELETAHQRFISALASKFESYRI